MFAIKRIISKFAANVAVKKYMKLKGMNLMNPLPRMIMHFLFKLLMFRTLYILTKSRINSDWSIALPLDVVPVQYKVDARAQCNIIPLTILEKFDSEPILCPMNIKLVAYNPKIFVLGKFSIALMHKKGHFDISYIVVNLNEKGKMVT